MDQTVVNKFLESHHARVDQVVQGNVAQAVVEVVEIEFELRRQTAQDQVGSGERLIDEIVDDQQVLRNHLGQRGEAAGEEVGRVHGGRRHEVGCIDQPGRNQTAQVGGRVVQEVRDVDQRGSKEILGRHQVLVDQLLERRNTFGDQALNPQ
ncbi:MAG: hypothetical protein GY708_00605 [Actinomycetia bacterium]|nr:hypothetical protein [Actinomycetes bacterium]